jgi:hypothetical protein
MVPGSVAVEGESACQHCHGAAAVWRGAALLMLNAPHGAGHHRPYQRAARAAHADNVATIARAFETWLRGRGVPKTCRRDRRVASGVDRPWPEKPIVRSGRFRFDQHADRARQRAFGARGDRGWPAV